MVECECATVGHLFGWYHSFNRYMVECELWYKKIIQGEYTVLIDTWWNVNCIARSSNLYRRFVLIDTWWNVNQEYPYFNLTGVSVLIDTWWNVNDVTNIIQKKNSKF